MSDKDKLRLRILYSTILQIISKQDISEEEIKILVEDKISFESGD